MRLTVLCTAAGVFGLFLFGWWDSPVSAWLALFLYGTFYLYLLKIAPGSALALFPAFGGVALTQFISGILIESGGYLTETKEMGSATGAFLRLAVTYALFFGTAALIIEHYIERWKRNGQIDAFVARQVRPFMPLARVIDVLIGVMLAYLVYVGVKNGFPLLTGQDRFDFANDVDDPTYLSLMGNRVMAMAYLGVMMAIAPKSGFYRFMAFGVLIVSALLGDKFTEYVISMGQLVGPSLCRMAWSDKGLPLRRIFVLGVVLVLITMPLVFVAYGGPSDASSGIGRMKDRMTLQGQLWFLADREVTDIVKFEEAPLIAEFTKMAIPEQSSKESDKKNPPYQGMSWMLLHFAPPSDAALRLKTGVVYCLGLHAYFLEMLGWSGLVVFNFIFAGLVGLIVAGALYSLIYGRLVYLLYFSKFLTFWLAASSVADPSMLVNWKTFLLLLSLGFYYLLDRRFNPAFFGPHKAKPHVTVR